MKLAFILVAMWGAAAANECSSGDTAYMCANLNTCWHELGFGSREELKYLCDVQGLPTEGGDGGDNGGGNAGNYNLAITSPPRNITVSPGSVAQFACTADDTIKVMIIARREYDNSAAEMRYDSLGASPSSQKVIQVSLNSKDLLLRKVITCSRCNVILTPPQSYYVHVSKLFQLLR